MVQILTKEYDEHSATLYRLVAIQPNIVTSQSQNMMQLTQLTQQSQAEPPVISTSWSRGAAALPNVPWMVPTRKKKPGFETSEVYLK